MKSSKDATPQLLSKKEVRSKIAQQLETALIDWKNDLGDKKFKKRIKKAGKILSKKIKHPVLKPATKPEVMITNKNEKAAV